jgi:protein-S-isoprenylcysteine O-methyltransferase Ste14
MNSSIAINESKKKMLFKVLIRFFLVFIFIGILIFLPAGTLKFFNGWLFVAGLLIPMTFTLIYLLIKDPELLEKRIKIKEKENAQKKYIKLSILLFVIAYIIPGLDFRFKWSSVPMWLVMVSLLIMICGYIGFIIVMLQNRYASRVIEIQNEQKLIDTGLYSFVRHPMYLSAIILYVASALVLGSYYTLIPMLLLPFLLAYRIKNEEKVLIKGLPGYEEYTKRVKYRMIPFIW